MSYNQRGNALRFFQPYIALATTDAGPFIEIDIGATGADHGEMICVEPCTIVRIGFTMVGELAGGTSTAPTVLFKKRPTPLSATGETTVGVLTIPDTTAVGATIFMDLDTNSTYAPINFDIGDSMEISHTVGTGTPTGIGTWWMVGEIRPEEPGNMTLVTASA